jgi:hypothetical protein
MESEHTQLLRRAERNRQRAKKCRELIRVIQNAQSIGLLEELATDLEGAAVTLEAQAELLPRHAHENKLVAGEQRPAD